MDDSSGTKGPPWPPKYEELLRRYLAPIAPTRPLESSDDLFELGLDSFYLIELFVELEAAFEVSFPDEALSAETFATVGGLWAILTELLAVDGRW